MKPLVLIVKPVTAHIESYLAETCRIINISQSNDFNEEQYSQILLDVEGILTTASDPITPELLARAPKLRVVSNMSVGYNNFDLQAMKDRHVIGTNTPGVLDETVADLIFALMLSAGRRIAELDAYVRAGSWKKTIDEEQFGIDVHHRTLGIIGMGRIGEAVARRGKWGFGMNVIYHNRNPKYADHNNPLDAQYRSMEQLLAEADYVVLMTPLTTETVKLIGAAQFALMKRTAIFINASRGQTVDEQALYEALRDRQIYAAGLDVFEQEPIAADHPLLGLNNVVIVPHIGSATQKTRDAMAQLAADNLLAGLKGERPENTVI